MNNSRIADALVSISEAMLLLIQEMCGIWHELVQHQAPIINRMEADLPTLLLAEIGNKAQELIRARSYANPLHKQSKQALTEAIISKMGQKFKLTERQKEHIKLKTQYVCSCSLLSCSLDLK
jgi:hypothetical protein